MKPTPPCPANLAHFKTTTARITALKPQLIVAHPYIPYR